MTTAYNQQPIKTHIVAHWFKTVIEPQLSKEKENPSVLHDTLCYNLFVERTGLYPSYNEFQIHLHRVYTRFGWLPTYVGTPDTKNQQVKRLTINDDSELTFNVLVCTKNGKTLPLTCQHLFKHFIPGWYQLTETWLALQSSEDDVETCGGFAF